MNIEKIFAGTQQRMQSVISLGNKRSYAQHMSNKVVTNTIAINAPIEKVWNALVDPNETKKYMFDCETVSDWNTGSELLWRGSYEGKEMVFVSGYVLEINAPSHLKYSVIDPNAAYPKTPENHLNVTYALSEKDGVTTLTVSQDGFEGAADGEKRYTEVYNKGEGWQPVLQEIKKVAEGK